MCCSATCTSRCVPAGWLHAQCGGGSNLNRLRQRVRALSQTPEFSEWLGNFREPWFFSDAESAAARLRAAGFENVQTELEPASYAATGDEEFQQYLRTFILHRHLELLPDEALRTAFVEKLTDAAAHDDPPWTLDYCTVSPHRLANPGEVRGAPIFNRNLDAFGEFVGVQLA
jgi:hypothetical protein